MSRVDTDFEERAAIMEYDGNMTRINAERTALEDIGVLCFSCSTRQKWYPGRVTCGYCLEPLSSLQASLIQTEDTWK